MHPHPAPALARQRSVSLLTPAEDVAAPVAVSATSPLPVLEALAAAVTWQAGDNNVSPLFRRAVDAVVVKLAQAPFQPQYAQEVLQCAIASSVDATGNATDVTVGLLDALLRSMAATMSASNGTPVPPASEAPSASEGSGKTKTSKMKKSEFPLLIGALALSIASNGPVSEMASVFASMVATPCPMTSEDTIRALWDACVVMPSKAGANRDYVVTLTVANTQLALHRLTNAVILQDVTRMFTRTVTPTNIHPHTDVLSYIDARQAEGSVEDGGAAKPPLYLYGNLALWSHFANVLGHVTPDNVETAVFAFVRSYGRPHRQRHVVRHVVRLPVLADTAATTDVGYDTETLPYDESYFDRPYSYDVAFPDNPQFRLAMPSIHRSVLLPVGPHICTLRKHQPASCYQEEIQAALCIAALLGVGMDPKSDDDDDDDDDVEGQDKKPDDDRFTAVLAHSRAVIRRVVRAAVPTLDRPSCSSPTSKKARMSTSGDT